MRGPSKGAIPGCLVALGLIVQRAADLPEAREIKEAIFRELEVVRDLFYEPEWVTRE